MNKDNKPYSTSSSYEFATKELTDIFVSCNNRCWNQNIAYIRQDSKIMVVKDPL